MSVGSQGLGQRLCRSCGFDWGEERLPGFIVFPCEWKAVSLLRPLSSGTNCRSNVGKRASTEAVCQGLFSAWGRRGKRVRERSYKINMSPMLTLDPFACQFGILFFAINICSNLLLLDAGEFFGVIWWILDVVGLKLWERSAAGILWIIFIFFCQQLIVKRVFWSTYGLKSI